MSLVHGLFAKLDLKPKKEFSGRRTEQRPELEGMMPDLVVTDAARLGYGNLFGLKLDGVEIIQVHRMRSPKTLSYIPVRLQSGVMRIVKRVQGGYDVFPKYPDDLDLEEYARNIIEAAHRIFISEREVPSFAIPEFQIVDLWIEQDIEGGMSRHLIQITYRIESDEPFCSQEAGKVPSSIKIFEMLPRTPGDEFLG